MYANYLHHYHHNYTPHDRDYVFSGTRRTRSGLTRTALLFYAHTHTAHAHYPFTCTRRAHTPAHPHTRTTTPPPPTPPATPRVHSFTTLPPVPIPTPFWFDLVLDYTVRIYYWFFFTMQVYCSVRLVLVRYSCRRACYDWQPRKTLRYASSRDRL